MLGAARLRTTIEEHGSGRQLLRVRAWPVFPAQWLFVALLLLALATGAMLQRHWLAGTILALPPVLLVLGSVRACGAALATIWRLLKPLAIKS